MKHKDIALSHIVEINPKYKDMVHAICGSCGRQSKILFASLVIACRKHQSYTCRSCTSKSIWEGSDYRNNITLSSIANANSVKGREQRRKQTLEAWRDDNYRKKISAKASQNYNFEFTAEIRHKLSESTKKMWSDPIYRNKMTNVLQQAACNTPKVSSIQEQLYRMLDELSVTYYRERNDALDDQQCKIGPYSFDCVIPRPNKPTLLIECQGDYWHNLAPNVARDRAKASYINNNFLGIYEIKYIWEHEFYCKDKVLGIIRYWLGIEERSQKEFDFNDVEINRCVAKDYRDLLAKYHYLSTAGRGGIAFGANFQGKLIAVCVFSPAIRQNIVVGKYTRDEIKELSRVCIHPEYQKKNFGSWFISKCIKELKSMSKKAGKCRCIISYADTTFNHDGALYKACNFKLDGEVKPDYWYVDKDGWVMHKKTLYNRARKSMISERQFAEENNFSKIWGKSKLRFVHVI